jgi:hypothetical protein
LVAAWPRPYWGAPSKSVERFGSRDLPVSSSLQNDFVAHLELARTRPENRDHGHRSHESRE